MGLMSPLFYCFRACLLLMLQGFVAKQLNINYKGLPSASQGTQQ